MGKVSSNPLVAPGQNVSGLAEWQKKNGVFADFQASSYAVVGSGKTRSGRTFVTVQDAEEEHAELYCIFIDQLSAFNTEIADDDTKFLLKEDGKRAKEGDLFKISEAVTFARVGGQLVTA